jgi:uncharacterized membrane protein YphA (DoxX/SURF4 family)
MTGAIVEARDSSPGATGLRSISGSGTRGYALSGRVLYAIGMIGFGAVCLVYVDFVNSLQPVPASLPGYAVLAVLTGVVLGAAGLAIMVDVKTRLSGIALASLFALWIALLHIPSAFTDPSLLLSPWWIRTFETLALAGAALILAGVAAEPVRERWVSAGRIAFGVSLPVFGILHFIYPESVAALVELSPAGYPWPLFWAYLTGFGHFAAGLAIATGVMSRLAAVLAGFMYASWALTLHLPRVIDNPPAYAGDRQELTSLLVCVAFWGAAWIVACVSTGRRGARSVGGIVASAS